MKLISPFWYMTALFVALGAWMLGVTIGATAWTPLREASVVPAASELDAEGRSVPVYTDIVQPDRDVTCEAVGPGKKRTPVRETSMDITVTDEVNEWHLIGIVTEGRDGMKVECTPKDKRLDNATYVTASVSGAVSRTTIGNGVAALGTAAAVGLAVATWISRRRHRDDPVG